MELPDVPLADQRRRRRARAAVPRRRQVVVRFSHAEYALVSQRAALAGLAVGAWIGEIAVDAATDGDGGAIGLPDLLRLHADVLMVERVAFATDVAGAPGVAGLLARLDAVIDVLVAQARRSTE
ncbi:hypothetical protein [Pseudonocardia nigra]|uniref:hypothetical protein n=1 Tax=Pseudonocardia nigra TaxID=1921578 RepID=UPI001C5ECF8E|nr:hypothetical protein [Pseudonocardia nigra]